MSDATHDHDDARAHPYGDAHDYGDTRDHGHEHGDGHDHPRGLRRVVLAIFAPHSHDASDSIDTALESSERGIRAVKISFLALIGTAAFQVAVIVVSGSVALLADTIHNFSDALTAIPLFIAFRLSCRPPTRRYTYGYGRAEDVAGLFVIAMITLSAIIAAYEAIRRLIDPQPIDQIGWVMAAGIVGFLGNELVALYRIREGNAIGSAALVADGYHARTDGFTSLAVVIGAIGVALGFERADPIAGLVISVAILAVLRTAAREILQRLMNAVDPALVDQIELEASRVTGVAVVQQVQVRWEGHRLRADLEIAVSATMNVVEAHHVAHAVEQKLLRQIAHLDGAAVHIEPDGPDRDTAHVDTHQHD